VKKLRVELGELAFAFENASWEMSHYLDLETGQVITITNETRRELEGIYEEIHDPESDQPVDLAEVLEEYDIHELFSLPRDRARLGLVALSFLHLFPEAERSHIGPHLSDVGQAFCLGSAFASIPPAQGILPVGRPN